MPYKNPRNSPAVCIFKKQGIITDITPAEKVFLIRHIRSYSVIEADRTKAMNTASDLYPAKSLHNGSGDAFRHCYFAALLTRDIGGAKAKDLTDLHEDWCGNPDGEREMDLHNNAAGLAIGRQVTATFPDAALADLCQKAEQGGKLKTLK